MDRFRAHRVTPQPNVTPVSQAELERELGGVHGGWSCGACGAVLVTGQPLLQVTCGRCGERWRLVGGRSHGGLGLSLLCWYVRERTN